MGEDGWGLGTDYKFTGQREEASLGIYFFNARWYDGSLGRFLSPDSIVPTSTQGTQAWDRYAFVNNNPVRYTDPTGHYGEPIHYMLTYWVVYSSAFMQAKTTLGYNPQAARVFAENLASGIAKGDMHADGWNEHAPIWEPDNDNPTPHWQTTEQALTQVENATTPEEFGFALHGYQDSFSHWRKLTADPNYNLGDNPSATDIYNAHRDCWFSGNCQIDNWTPWDNEIDQEMYEGMLQLIDDYVADYIADIETQEGQTEAE